jgi:cytochrome c
MDTSEDRDMASLEMNKFAAGIICAGLLAMAAGKIADVMVHPMPLEKNAYVVDTSALVGAAAPAASEGPSLEPVLAMLATADAAAGQKAFKKCAACHTTEKGGKNKVGPNLYAVVNGIRAANGTFKYSGAMKELGGNWDYASLNGFLAKPKAYLPGTKMGFAGLKKIGDRASVIAYLRTLADTPAALPSAEDIAKEANGG